MEKLLFIDRLTEAIILSDACRRAVMLQLRCRKLAEGSVFTLPSSAGELILITQGTARLFVVTNDGKDVSQHFAGVDDLVGRNLTPQRGAPESLEAIDELSCVCLSLAALDELMTRFPELSAFYATFLSNQSLRARERQSRDEPVETYERFLQAYPGLETHVPTVHLASFLNLSPDEFMRARQKFRERGLM